MADHKYDNKQIKDDKNDCVGIMGKSKQVAKCAPSCSAVQFGGQDKPWTGMAGAFVEQQHMFVSFKTKSHQNREVLYYVP